jgi:small-conductance mechanosensitive channel/CRP-like cAMP-binding protein
MKKLSLPLAISGLLLLVYVLLLLFRRSVLFQPDAQGDFKPTVSAQILLAVLLLSVSIVIVRAADFALFDILFYKRKGRVAPALLRGMLSTVLYFICFILIYRFVLEKYPGIEILATSTVLTVIIGLALQDTLGNFFAGLSLHVEEPFHILDAIKIGNELGKVESVTWRATTLRTNNNSILVYPNSKIAREMMEIYPYNNLNRRVLQFPAPYSAAPQKVIPLIQEAVKAVPNVAPEKTPIVRIAAFADSSITYEILYWIRDYMNIHDTDAKIREHIWYIYSRNDLYIPFPVRHFLYEPMDQAKKGKEVDYRGAIEAVDLFEPMTAQEKEAVAKAMVHYVYAPGELILRRGEAGDSMFIIHRGRVEVKLPGSNGNMQRVALLEPGNCFGEMALLTGEPRNADVYAFDEVEILEIRKAVIQQLIDENNDLAEAFSQKMARRQAKLDEYSQAAPEREERMRSQQNILRRIKRFFSVK